MGPGNGCHSTKRSRKKEDRKMITRRQETWGWGEGGGGKGRGGEWSWGL